MLIWKITNIESPNFCITFLMFVLNHAVPTLNENFTSTRFNTTRNKIELIGMYIASPVLPSNTLVAIKFPFTVNSEKNR